MFLKNFHIQLDHVELHKNFANLHQDKFCLLFMFSSDLVLGFASVVPSYDRSVVTMRKLKEVHGSFHLDSSFA